MGVLAEALAATRRRASTTTAITDARRSLTFGELERRAGALARAMGAHGARPDAPVALVLGRSVHAPLAMLAALEAGICYVPIDPRAPDERTRTILGDCAPAVLICDGETGRRAAAMAAMGSPAPRLLDLEAFDDPGSPSPAPSAGDLHDKVPADDREPPACVLYTSGSTGRPKGVMLSQENILGYVRWAADELALGPADVVLGTAPFHFDMSLFDVYATQLVGARLAIAGDGHTLFPRALVQFAAEQGVTVWKGVASLLVYLQRTGTLTAGGIPALRTVLFAGEALPTRTLIAWMRAYPEVTFYNAYGPTEATGVSVFHPIPAIPADAGETIPIGTPCPGTDAAVVGEDDRPVVGDAVGELYLGGACLSRGYLGRPDETARAFAPWSGDGAPARRMYRTGDLVRYNHRGELCFVGRRDDQVKVMGYRIELGEIEAALTTLDGVGDAGAVRHEDPTQGLVELVAIVELDRPDAADDLVERLSRRLPAYMLPRRVLAVPRVPRTDRGKLDRAALTRLAAEGAPPASPAAARG